jgi:DNA-binding MarR family transcriptional regulator
MFISMETNPGNGSGISALETHLGYWLRRVSNHISDGFARRLREQQTSVAEWVLLRQLLDRVQATPGELADVLAMTRGAVSKIVDKVEAKGWVTAKGTAEDRRVRQLYLTRAGQRAIPVLSAIADQNDEKFFACLDTGERDTLRKLLIKLAECNDIQDVPVE